MIRGCLEGVVTQHREMEEKLQSFLMTHAIAPLERAEIVEQFVNEQKELNEKMGK